MPHKPKILLLVDRPGWVFDTIAKAYVKYLSDDFDFNICYVVENPDLEKWNFDLLYIFFWGETYHQKFNINPKKIVKEISSYRWMNEPQYGLLNPKEMANRYLYDAGSVTSTSKSVMRLLSPYRTVHWMPNGYDPDIFQNKVVRSGPIKIGWAGNINDPCKGIADIVIPAIGDDYHFAIAHDLSFEKMPDFYNNIDVYVIASTAEGQPITLIESMACGCFPVCVDTGIVPEIITHRKNGLIVDRKVESFRAAFYWCNLNKDYIRNIGGNNAKNISGIRSWSIIIKQCKQSLFAIIERVNNE